MCVLCIHIHIVSAEKKINKNNINSKISTSLVKYVHS